MSAWRYPITLVTHIFLWQTCAGFLPESETPVVLKITDLRQSCKSETWTNKLRIHADCKNCNVIASVERCGFPETQTERVTEHRILCSLSPSIPGVTDFILDCGQELNGTCQAGCVLSYRQRVQVGSVMTSTLDSVTRIAVGVLSIFMFFFVFYLLKRIRDQRRQGIQRLSQEDV